MSQSNNFFFTLMGNQRGASSIQYVILLAALVMPTSYAVMVLGTTVDHRLGAAETVLSCAGPTCPERVGVYVKAGGPATATARPLDHPPGTPRRPTPSWK